MPNHYQTPSQGMTSEAPQDRIKEVIYLIRRLMQAGELYTKELSKKYQVSAPQVNCLLALYENGPSPRLPSISWLNPARSPGL